MFAKNNTPVWFGLYIVLLCFLSGTHAYAQEMSGMIGCDTVTTSADSIIVPIFIDTGAEQFDTARMEMLFDAAVLSNPQFAVGDAFNLDFGQEMGMGSVTAVLSRNALLGATSGRAEFATVTFDWTGVSTTLNFTSGDDSDESGSLAFLVGTDSSLINEACTVGVAVAITPTPTDTPVPTATDTPVPIATDTLVPADTNTPTPTPTSISPTDEPISTNTPIAPTDEPTDTPTPTNTATPTAIPAVTSQPTGCTAPQWVGGDVYETGDVVSHNGREWEAKWYSNIATDEPGTTGEFGVWSDLGACTATASSPTPVTPATAVSTATATATATNTPVPTATNTPTPTSTPGVPLSTTTGSVQATAVNASVLTYLIVTAALLTIGIVLFMKKKVHLFVLLFVATLTIWSYPTISASGTLISPELCLGLQGERSDVQAEPLIYELHDFQGNVVASGFAEAHPSSDDGIGCFVTEAVPPGVYDVFINPEPDMLDHLNRLVEFINITNLGEYIYLVTSSGNVVLQEGDMNGDNQIDNDDLDIFVSTFDLSAPLCEGDTGYDERADLNEDDCVTILDASLLASNLNPDNPLTGDVPE